MSSVGRAAGRLLPRPRERTEGYAFCPDDRYWFRPAYTEGKCPICGEAASAGAPPRWAGIERSWLGLGALALESLIMLAIVLYMFFRG